MKRNAECKSDTRPRNSVFAISLTALALTAGITARSDAQTFQFSPTGGLALGSTVFSTLTITATATSNFFNGDANLAQYNITGISGSFNGNAITGLLAPGTTIGGVSVNNALTSLGTGLTGTVAIGQHSANSHASLGFGFSTSAGSFIVCDIDCALGDPQVSLALRVHDSSGVIGGSNGTFNSIAVAVPGPLAGAGMLSYVATMLMALAWLRRNKRGGTAAPAKEQSEIEEPKLSTKVRLWFLTIRAGELRSA